MKMPISLTYHTSTGMTAGPDHHGVELILDANEVVAVSAGTNSYPHTTVQLRRGERYDVQESPREVLAAMGFDTLEDQRAS